MVERLMARASDSRLVYSTGGEVAAAEPKPAGEGSRRPGIRIRLDRRASGRLVTVVSGLPGTFDDVRALARALKAACGAGGTAREATVEIQGDHRERVAAALAARGLRFKHSGG